MRVHQANRHHYMALSLLPRLITLCTLQHSVIIRCNISEITSDRSLNVYGYIGYIQIESQTSEIIAGRECERLVSGVVERIVLFSSRWRSHTSRTRTRCVKSHECVIVYMKSLVVTAGIFPIYWKGDWYNVTKPI